MCAGIILKKLYRDRELEQAQLARPAGQERDFTENCGQSSLLQALSRLPGAQREALTLYYFDELKIREIARITGTNTATVKSRLHQGKQKLKKNIGGGKPMKRDRELTRLFRQELPVDVQGKKKGAGSG